MEEKRVVKEIKQPSQGSGQIKRGERWGASIPLCSRACLRVHC